MKSKSPKSPRSPLNINTMYKKNLELARIAMLRAKIEKNVKKAIKNAKELQKLTKQLSSLKI